MNQLILDYLKQQKFEGFQKLNFSPVPKGEEGDIAISFFQLTKELKKNPVQIAQEVDEILKKSELIEETKIAGPYLNITFKSEIFFKKVFEAPLESNLLLNKNIVLEYSGPNTNKPLHLGHMRNHALGLSLSRILKQAGATVHPVNIINDRGIHICKSMLAYQKFGEGKTPESEGKKPDHFVGDYYVKFDEESKKDPKLNDEVQQMLLDWEAGKPEVRALWKKMNDWTITGHQETYDRQYIKFEKRYLESEYYLEGKNIAQKGLEKGVFEKREDGAIVINFEDEQLGEKVILRADGTSIYLTQDLAVAVARDKDFNHPDEMIYTVADEQNYHFKVLFQCLDKLGVMNAEKCHHLSYGLVHLPDGRMKSREGNVVDADNLMDELHELAEAKIRSNNTSSNSGLQTADTESNSNSTICNSSPGQGRLGGVDKNTWTNEEINQIAEQIQNAAWKFYLLRTTPIKSMVFDKEKSIDFQGSTGPYLQYAGVRIKSILKKYNSSSPPGQGGLGGVETLSNPEKPLGVKILEWPHTLNRAAEGKNPTYILTYLLELAQTWSSFYAENSVLNAETEALINARVALASKVLDILEAGLNCLGIEMPDRM